jgi:ribosomal protein L29
MNTLFILWCLLQTTGLRWCKAFGRNDAFGSLRRNRALPLRSGLVESIAETCFLQSCVVLVTYTTVSALYDIWDVKSDVRTLKTLKCELKVDIASNRLDISALRSELKADIRALKSESNVDIWALKSELNADIRALKSELAGLKADFASTKSDNRALKSDIESDIGALKSYIRALKSDIESDIGALKSDIRALKSDIGLY